MAAVVISVRWVAPWWWREYFGFLLFVDMLGFDVDLDQAAAFLVKHGRFRWTS